MSLSTKPDTKKGDLEEIVTKKNKKQQKKTNVYRVINIPYIFFHILPLKIHSIITAWLNISTVKETLGALYNQSW